MKSQAEVKLRKLRETLTDNADGNPEPSPDNREGAETRHGVCLVCDGPIIGRQKTAKYCSTECRKVDRRKAQQNSTCLKCENQIPENKNANAKFCSAGCRNNYNTYKYAIKNRIESPGVGSGGNQWGEKNHQYKNGIGTFSKEAFRLLPNQCNRCSSNERLLVHHKDHDRTNNNINNLEILCKRCHQHHHCTRDENGKFVSIT